MKKVAIVIVNWNSQRLGYAEGLLTLNNIDYPADKYHVFVVDNASEDGSPDFLEQRLYNTTVIRNNTNTGFAPANNQIAELGIREGYDYIYLLNHDTEVEPDFLRKAVEMMDSQPNVGSVQSRLMLYQQPGTINSIGNSIHFLGFGFSNGGYEKLDNYKREDFDGKEIAYGSGAGVLVNLEAVKKVGLFDPAFFMYHEDLDLGWQIKLAGYKNLLSWDSVVYHKYEFSKSVKKYYFMERNRYIVLWENYKLLTLLLIFPALLAFEIGMLPFSFKAGFGKEKLRMYGYFFKLSSWVSIFKNRFKKQSRRVTPDREVLKNFSGSIANQHVNNFVLNRIANPIFQLYFWLLKKIVVW